MQTKFNRQSTRWMRYSALVLFFGLLACDKSDGPLAKAVSAPTALIGSSVKIVLEHGPEPADYAAAMTPYRNGLLTACEKGRVEALGGTFNPALLPTPEVLVKAIMRKTEEYFEPGRYARYTYKYFISQRAREVPDADMCFPTPSKAYVLETIDIKTRCQTIQITLPTPDGLSPGTKTEDTLSEKDCAISYQSNLSRSQQDQTKVANYSDGDTVFGNTCVYEPAIVVSNTVTLPKSEVCRLKQMPFHPIAGKDVVLKINDSGVVGDGLENLVLADVTLGRTIVKARAFEVTVGTPLSDTVFQVPASAANFKKPL